MHHNFDHDDALTSSDIAGRTAPPAPALINRKLEGQLAAMLGTNADRSWMARAQCRDRKVSHRVFFVAPMTVRHLTRAEVNKQRTQRQVAEAQCTGCPVRTECLEYALATNSADGIWGGTTERERRAIAASRRAEMRTAS
jgi:hypothetical protein